MVHKFSRSQLLLFNFINISLSTLHHPSFIVHPRGATEYKKKKNTNGVRSLLSADGDKLCSREEAVIFFWVVRRRAPPLTPARANKRATSGARAATFASPAPFPTLPRVPSPKKERREQGALVETIDGIVYLV